jgi:hypothetical protein
LPNTGDPDPNSPYYPQGYIVEYGGMPGDPVLQISASTIIVIPRIESTAPGSICGSGNVTLQATASNGGAYWYTTVTGGSAILQEILHYNFNTTTSYYVDGTNGNCQDIPRMELLHRKDITNNYFNSAAAVCDSGTATLEQQLQLER